MRVNARPVRVIVVALVLSGCSAAGVDGQSVDPRPSPEIQATALVDPGAGNDDCFSVHRSFEPDRTVENRVKESTTVVVGGFLGYGDSFWDSPTGSRPPIEEVSKGNARLLTPVKIGVTVPIKGDVADIQKAVVWGGTLDCDRFTSDNSLDLADKQAYVFFLASVTDSRGELGNNVMLLDAWPVDAQSIVETPREGTRSLDQLTREIVAGRPDEPPATLNPNEPPGHFLPIRGRRLSRVRCERPRLG